MKLRPHRCEALRVVAILSPPWVGSLRAGRLGAKQDLGADRGCPSRLLESFSQSCSSLQCRPTQVGRPEDPGPLAFSLRQLSLSKPLRRKGRALGSQLAQPEPSTLLLAEGGGSEPEACSRKGQLAAMGSLPSGFTLTAVLRGGREALSCAEKTVTAREKGPFQSQGSLGLTETAPRPQTPTEECQSNPKLVCSASGEMEARRGDVTGPRAHS